MHGRTRLKAGGHRARAERTENMKPISVTPDVSKLSDWLNADALCRVESRAYDMWRDAARGAEGCGPLAHGEGSTEG